MHIHCSVTKIYDSIVQNLITVHIARNLKCTVQLKIAKLHLKTKFIYWEPKVS